MLFDLNIPWPVTDYKSKPLENDIRRLKSILLVLEQLQYSHVAFNFQLDPTLRITKKDFDHASPNPIDLTLFKEFEGRIKIYSRITITLTDPADFPGLKHFNDSFDIIAIQPTNDKSLSMATTNLEVDIITFNYTDNLRFWLRNKAVHSGIAKGRKFEIVYRSLLDPETRKNFLSVTKHVIRASRSVGIFISSGAVSALHVKTQFDLVNLLKLANVSHHQIPIIINQTPAKVLLNGKLRNVSYKQAIAAGDDVLEAQLETTNKNDLSRYKRKIDEDELSVMNKLQKVD